MWLLKAVLLVLGEPFPSGRLLAAELNRPVSVSLCTYELAVAYLVNSRGQNPPFGEERLKRVYVIV